MGRTWLKRGTDGQELLQNMAQAWNRRTRIVAVGPCVEQTLISDIRITGVEIECQRLLQVKIMSVRYHGIG